MVLPTRGGGQRQHWKKLVPSSVPSHIFSSCRSDGASCVRPALAAPWWALNTSTNGMVISYEIPLLLQPREEVLLGKASGLWSSRPADVLQLRRTHSSWDMSMIPAAAHPHDGDHSWSNQTEPLFCRYYRTKKYV